jgi:hypothetical protein
MKQKWKKISFSDKIVWLNSINNETKICYLTYKDGKTPLPKGWNRWFSTTHQLFYYTYNDNNGHKQIKWESPNKFNQHDYSPTEEPITIDLDLKDDVNEKIYRIGDGEINLKWHGNIIPCILKTADDIKSIEIIGKPYDKPLVINGYTSQQTRNICLDFVFLKDEKIAYIELLSVFNNNCPGPEKGQGSFFLALVDEICRQLEIKTLKLNDQSTIRSKDGLEVSLEFQSLMKYGLSWYERHGFTYKDESKKSIVKQIRNTPISKIKKFLEDNLDELPSKINNTLRIIAEYEKDEQYTDLLSGFLTYVWNKNNSNNFLEYIEILSVLYPQRKSYMEMRLPAFPSISINESILPAFPRQSNMIKVFSM